MAATRGTPVTVTEMTIGTDEVTLSEHESTRGLCELAVERGGERWHLRVHHDGAVEPVDSPRASPPVWVARVVRSHELASE